MAKTRDTLRCLAIRQPWAWAIAIGAKDIENREWSTDHRGLFVIQASGAKTLVNRISREFDPEPPPVTFAYGALIGVAEIVDVVTFGRSLRSNPWACGHYCFKLANARMFKKPIPAKGKLNLYYLDPKLDALVRKQLPQARPTKIGRPERAWIEKILAPG